MCHVLKVKIFYLINYRYKYFIDIYGRVNALGHMLTLEIGITLTLYEVHLDCQPKMTLLPRREFCRHSLS